jgi:hypothetical protein
LEKPASHLREKDTEGTQIFTRVIEILCEHMDKVDRWGFAKKSYKPSCHIIGREFLDHQVFKKDFHSL